MGYEEERTPKERKKRKMQVVSVNVSGKKGTVKRPVPEIRIDEHGVVDDAHAGPWHRQVSMLSREIVEEFEAEAGRKIKPGEFAENITVRDIDLRTVCILDRFTAGQVKLEVTQIGKECHGNECAVYREVGKCVMPEDGIFCRVIKGGKVKAGDPIQFLPRSLRFKIITVSDRASRGEYEDRSGPRLKALLDAFLQNTRWHPEIEAVILPDDADRLRSELAAARDSGVDVILTTGGTGVGPRDITPDVVSSLADKIIPGIMEHIRVKFGKVNPNALLSRGVAAVLGQSLVYALPGSVRGVEEYMAEIVKTVEHLILMLHGLDVH